MNISIFFAIIAMLFFGIGNVIQKPAVEKIGAVKTLTIRGIVASFITFIAAAVSFTSLNTDIRTWTIAVFFALVGYLGLYFFNYALNFAKAGIVVPIAFSRIIIITLVCIVFLEEHITPGTLIFIFIILLGTVLVSLKKSSFNEPEYKKGIVFALLAALFWGISLPFFGKFSVLLGTFIFTFLVEFLNLIISVIQTKLFGKVKKIMPEGHEIKQNKILFLMIGLAGGIASISMNLAYQMGNVSIASAIIGVSPLISVIVSRIYLKEKMNIQQYIGALIIVTGIVGITLG